MGWNPLDTINDIFEEVVSWFVDIPEAQRGIEINRSSRNDPIPVVYGRDKVESANWAYWSTSGKDNRYLYIWAAFCEGEIDGFEEIWIDDKPLAEFGQQRRETYPDFTPPVGDDIVVIREYLGTDDQVSDTLLQAVDSRWTTDHRLRGVAGLVVRMRWSDKYFSGLPKLAAVVRGRKVLNAAGTAAEWTQNAALILRDYRTSKRFGEGKGWPADFDQTSWQAAFTDCEDTETFFTAQSLGQPDELVDAGGEKYLRWDSKPGSAVALADIAVTGSGGASATGRTGFMSNGWYGALGGYYLPYDTVSGAFTPADTVTIEQTAGKLFSFNGTLNGGSDFDTILDNVKRIRAVMRGDMPKVQGKWHLYVEKARTPEFTVTESDIYGGLEWGAPKSGDKYNRVTVKYINPSAEWKEDIAIWPDPGSPEETQFLTEDNGKVLTHDLSIEGVRNAYQAKDLARIICLKSRSGLNATLTCDPWLLGYHCGQVGAFNWTGTGWADEPFTIKQRGLTEDGKVLLGIERHVASIYPYAPDTLDVIKDITSLPDPFTIEVPDNVITATVLDRLEEKLPSQIAIYIDTQFDRVDDEFVRDYEVRTRVVERYDLQSQQWVPAVGAWDVYPRIPQVAETETTVTYFAQVNAWLRRYEVQVRCVNDAGVLGDWSPAVVHEVFLDTTAPDPPVIDKLVPGAQTIAVTVTPDDDPDYSHAKVYVNTVNDFATASVGIEVLRGTDGVIPGLMSETAYYVWATSFDDVGNESGPSTPLSTTTLVLEGEPPREISGSGPPTEDGAFAGQIYQDTDTGKLYEWSGTAWVDHIPADPSGLVLTNEDGANPGEFVDDEASFAWDPGAVSFYEFYAELRWNGELKDQFKTRDRGGSNAGSSLRYSFADAIKVSDTLIDGEPVIENGARTLTLRLYTLSSDGFTRSANYQELTVTNVQEPAPRNGRLVKNLYGVFVVASKPDGSDLQGIAAYADTSPGFTPGPGNLLGYYSIDSPFINIGGDLNESTEYYVRFGWYDKWGRDNIALTGDLQVLTDPPAFNRIIKSATAPVYGAPDYFVEGDVWVNTSQGDNQYQWIGGGPGGAWVDIQDDAIVAAQATADRKAVIFRQDNPPSSGVVEGEHDQWIDTNDGNRQYLWVGTPPAGGWVDAQDVDIAAAQTTADSAVGDAANAQITANTADAKAETADGKADAAQGTADQALSDANNITEGQIVGRAVTRPKIKQGDVVQEYQVTLASVTYNNPADGVGSNTNMGGVTFIAKGDNVQVTASCVMSVAGYANTDPEDLPKMVFEVYVNNNTTGLSTRVIAAGDMPAPKSRRAPFGNIDNACTIGIVGSDTADPGEVGPPPQPVIREGDSITIRARAAYWRGDTGTQATSATFTACYMEVVELNNV